MAVRRRRRRWAHAACLQPGYGVAARATHRCALMAGWAVVAVGREVRRGAVECYSLQAWWRPCMVRGAWTGHTRRRGTGRVTGLPWCVVWWGWVAVRAAQLPLLASRRHASGPWPCMAGRMLDSALERSGTTLLRGIWAHGRMRYHYRQQVSRRWLIKQFSKLVGRTHTHIHDMSCGGSGRNIFTCCLLAWQCAYLHTH